jgi:sec-independent protein translocase protein TatC
MVTNSDFNFTNNEIVTLELPFSEHIEELRQRLFHIFWIILFLTGAAFIEVKLLVKILELPVDNVKFFQLSPGEYFVSTVKISFYTGLLFGSPFAIGQIILFLLPGLTKKETKVILPLLLSSLCLFGLGLLFFLLCLNSRSIKFFFKV